jgi:small redox-active disulfide protein 2
MVMEIKILGTGCPKCKRLSDATEHAAKELGIEIKMEKVTDMAKILSYSVMSTPALVVNGTVKVMGRVPSNDELKEMLSL